MIYNREDCREQMSLEQEKFLPDVLYRDNAMIARDLIFLPIHTTSKTKKNRKEVVKRTFDMRRRNTLSFISHISMLPVGTNSASSKNHRGKQRAYPPFE